MENKSSTMHSAKYKLVLVLFSFLGVTLVFLSTSRYGAGLSPDSVGYIGTARNIISGAGIVSYDGSPLIVQPPLFPILLAFIGGLFKTDPLILANIVNAIIFGLIVYIGGLLIFKYLSFFPAFALIGTLTILASVPLFEVSVMTWSEPLFILFVILSFLFANSYLEKNDLISLILLSLSIAFSTLTRYIGVVLILWGVFIITVLHRNSFKNKLTHLSLFTFVSVLPIGILVIKNYVISNTLFGPRVSSMFTLPQNLMFVFNVLITWYIPNIIADHRPTLILFGMVIGYFAGLIPNDSWKNMKAKLHQITPIALFVVFYTMFLVVSSTTTAFDQINDRLLSPIYVPLTLISLILFQALVEPYSGRIPKKVMDILPLFVLAMWLLVYPIRNVTINAVNLASLGNGYSGKTWLESQVVQYLRKNQSLESECTIYTNAPDAAYILAGLKTKMSPEKNFYNSKETKNDISRIETIWLTENNKVCLVWFDRVNRKHLFTVDELQTIANVTLIAHFDDGALYSVIKK